MLHSIHKYRNSSEVFPHIEARASFVGELAMAVHSGARKLALKVSHECTKGGALFGSASIFCFLIGIKSTDVADADAVGIVIEAMRTNLLQRTASMNGAIAVDDKVIADALPPACLVPAVDVGHGIVLALNRGGTMKDDFSDLSHGGDV